MSNVLFQEIDSLMLLWRKRRWFRTMVGYALAHKVLNKDPHHHMKKYMQFSLAHTNHTKVPTYPNESYPTRMFKYLIS